MNTACRKLLLLAPLLCVNPATAGVNCDGVPYTRLELAVCGEPVLRALDGELTEALNDARSRGVINNQAIAAQRNRIARQCRREASNAFNACLLDAELSSLEWVANKLGQSNVIFGSVSSKRWRYDASLSARTSQLKRQLKVAENRLRSTADPELTVVTILDLISAYKAHPAQRSNVARSNVASSNVARAIGQLERRLVAGCDHVVYGADWRSVLSDYNIACKDLQQPALFSSSDF